MVLICYIKFVFIFKYGQYFSLNYCKNYNNYYYCENFLPQSKIAVMCS